MSDLQSKYQKLAAEYSKIRAQIPVLKKAVLDEQAASEELKEILKSKDQSIRKYEQEVDSLTFRNQQLEQRVSILQKELEEEQPNHVKKQKDKKSSVSSNLMQSFEVIDEELRLKIEENAKLHRQLSDLGHEHQRETSGLRERLGELESDLERYRSDLDDYKTKHQGEVERLTALKDKLEVERKTHEREKLKSLEKVQTLEQEMTTITNDLLGKLNQANKTIKEKLPFNDTADESLNSLNIGSHTIQNHDRLHSLLRQTHQLSDGFLEAFKNLLGHIEVKVNALTSNSDFVGATSDLRQFLQRLGEGDSVLEPMATSLLRMKGSLDDDSFLSSMKTGDLSSLSETTDYFVSYAKQIVSCALQCLEIESNQSSCTEALSQKISDLRRSLVQFAASLTDVHDSLSAVVVVVGDAEYSNRHKKLMQLSQEFMKWSDCCKDLARSHKSKTTLEHQLPTCGTNLKVANERISGSLVDLVEIVSKLSSFLSSNVRGFSDLLDFLFSSGHPCLPALRTRAVDYRKLITKTTPADTVPMSVAIQNRKLIDCFTENKNDLSQQVLQLQEKLNKVEQEKEHWSLEAQLMTMKYKKEMEKFNALTRNVEVSDSSKLVQSEMIATSEQLGKLEAISEPGEVDDPDWITTKEKIMSDHYDKRINDLISNLQSADSKALYFHSECRALHKQLVGCLRERDRLLAELNSTNQNLASLKDELQTTSRSYEGQLSLMSEHLAGMNEKLTTQKDEIDALKYQLLQHHHHHNQQQQQNPGNRNLLRRGK